MDSPVGKSSLPYASTSRDVPSTAPWDMVLEAITELQTEVEKIRLERKLEVNASTFSEPLVCCAPMDVIGSLKPREALVTRPVDSTGSFS